LLPVVFFPFFRSGSPPPLSLFFFWHLPFHRWRSFAHLLSLIGFLFFGPSICLGFFTDIALSFLFRCPSFFRGRGFCALPFLRPPFPVCVFFPPGTLFTRNPLFLPVLGVFAIQEVLAISFFFSLWLLFLISAFFFAFTTFWRRLFCRSPSSVGRVFSRWLLGFAIFLRSRPTTPAWLGGFLAPRRWELFLVPRAGFVLCSRCSHCFLDNSVCFLSPLFSIVCAHFGSWFAGIPFFWTLLTCVCGYLAFAT